jgi:hypothetical protein
MFNGLCEDSAFAAACSPGGGAHRRKRFDVPTLVARVPFENASVVPLAVAFSGTVRRTADVDDGDEPRAIVHYQVELEGLVLPAAAAELAAAARVLLRAGEPAEDEDDEDAIGWLGLRPESEACHADAVLCCFGGGEPEDSEGESDGDADEAKALRPRGGAVVLADVALGREGDDVFEFEALEYAGPGDATDGSSVVSS